MKRLKGRIVSFIMALAVVLSVAQFIDKPVQAATDYGTVWKNCSEKVNWTIKDGLVPWDKTAKEPTTKDDDDYYKVYTAEELTWVMTNNKNFRLYKDIDLGGRDDAALNKNWTPVTVNKPMKIDGNNYTIFNLSVNTAANNSGFIGNLNSTLTMENLNFYSMKIKASSNTGIIGFIKSGQNATIRNCSLENSWIRADSIIGGFVGYAYDSGNLVDISNSHTKNFYIYGNSCVGNFVGPITGKVTNCYAIDGKVLSAGGHSGGMTSCSGNHAFSNCFTNVDVYGNTETGAFIGYINIVGETTYTNCYSSGSIEGTNTIGGFVATVRPNISPRFTNCYSTAMVGMLDKASNLGGFAGNVGDNAIFNNCFAAGEVGSLDTNTSSFTNIGGFSGSATGTYGTPSYYDKQTTAMRNIGGGKNNPVGRTTAELTGKIDENTNEIVVQGFDTSESGAWIAQKGLYPQLKVFANPEKEIDKEGNPCGFTGKDAEVAKAYSAASASTAFLRDETTEIPNLDEDATPEEIAKETERIRNNYDTVRDIKDLFSFTSKTKNAEQRKIEWRVDPAHYDDGKEDIYSPVSSDPEPLIPIISLVDQGKNDRVSDMAPGIGWVRVDVTPKGQEITGNRVMRIVPTTTVSLGKASPDMGIGSDVRLYPDIEGELKSYDHRAGVKFTQTSAAELNKPKPIIHSGGFTEETYKKVPVNLKTGPTAVPETRGEVTVTIAKYSVDGKTLISKDVVPKTDDPNAPFVGTPEEKAESERYQKLFVKKGSDDNTFTNEFTKDDYGTYVINYSWSVDNTLQTSSKKLYVLPSLKVTYKWNDGIHTDKVETPDTDESIYTAYGDDVSEHRLKIGDSLSSQKAELPKDPTRTGYSFVGWTTNPNAVSGDDSPLFTADTVLDGDVTLHALWKVRKYDVAFDYPDYYTKDNPLNIKVVKDVEYGKTMDAAYPLEDPEVGFLDEEKNVIFTGWSTMKPDNLPKDDQNNTIAQSVNVRESTTIDTSETGLAYYEHYGYFKDEKEDEKTVITLYPVLKTYSEDILYYKNDGSKQNEGKGDILKTVTAIYDNCFTKPEDPKRDGYTFLGWSKTQKADYQSPEHEPFVTEYSETEKYLGEGMSFFAVWERIPYTAELYKNDGSIEENPYNKVENLTWGDQLTESQLKAPQRKGYSFGGWNTQADGKGTAFTVDTHIEGNTVLYVVWTKDPYTLLVYKTPGEATKPEMTLKDLPYGAALGSNLPSAEAYYTNAEGQKFAFTGWLGSFKDTITGEPVVVTADTVVNIGQLTDDLGTLTATYNQKVYDITGSKYGHGSITGGTGTFKEGDNCAVTWEADEGYKVSKVMVNGKVRDDLLSKSAVVFEKLDQNHSVYVTFDKDNGEDGDEEPSTQWYTVTTVKTGGGDSKLTATATVEKNKNYTVEWKAAEGYVVKRISVDGVDYPQSNEGSIPFDKIGSDHQVNVIFEKIEGMGGGSTPGFYTITTNQIGGDPLGVDTSLSKTAVMTKNSEKRIEWHAENGYIIESIIIDDNLPEKRVVLNPEEVAKGGYDFKNIDADHTVDVIFKAPDGSTKPEDGCKIITHLVGGPGEITSSAEVKKGNDFTVSWNLPDSITNENSPTYNHYVVEKVIVNGEEKPKDTTNEEMKNITRDQKVTVILKPNLFDVEISKGGQGTIDPSKTMFYGENYTANAKPAAGWYLQKVIMDGETINEFEDPSQTASAVSKMETFFKEHVVLAAENNIIDIDPDTQTVSARFQKITQNHQVKVIFAELGAPEIPQNSQINVSTRIEGGPGIIEGGGVFVKGQGTTVKWHDIPDGFVVEKVMIRVGGVERNDIAYADGAVQLDDLQDNYEIIVKVKNGYSDEMTDDDAVVKYNVTTAISGVAGATITPSQYGMAAGSDVNVVWAYNTTKYEAKEVKVNGVTLEALETEMMYSFGNIQSDCSLEVVLGEKEPLDPGKDQFSITTGVANNLGGTIDKSVVVNRGESKTINWKANDGYEVLSVIVDGRLRDDLSKLGPSGSTQFDQIDANHTIMVSFKKSDGSDVKPDYFVVETSKEGKGTITKTQSLKAGTNHTVTFKAAAGYTLTRVEIDGMVCNEYIEIGSVFFEALSGNHKVNVIFEKEKPVDPDNPKPPVDPDENKVQVTVKIESGLGTASESTYVKKGERHEVTYQPEEGYHVEAIYVNGESRPDLINKNGSFTLKIDEDTIISIKFKKNDQGTNPGNPEDPNNPGQPGKPGDSDNTGETDGANGKPDKDKPWAENNLLNGKYSVTLSSFAPLTGIRGGETMIENSRYISMMQYFFGGNGQNGALTTSTQMSLFNLSALALTVMFTVITVLFKSKKKTKIMGLILSLTAFILFAVTQPMVWSFVLFDNFTGVFALILLAEIAVLMISKKRKKEEKKVKREVRAE